jgi:cytochrome c oxidase cbb3-type subunit 3
VVPAVLPNYGGLSATTFYMLVSVIGVEIAAIFFLTFSIKRVYDELVPQKAVAVPEQKEKWWSNLDQRFFTKAIPVEKEADHLLDHNYDGIRELDNALPPWWKYGFIITIVIAFLYLINFHVLGTGKNPTEEYAAEMEVAKIQKEQFEAKNKDRIDESSVPMADAAGVKQGGEYFAANCIACHGKLGEGGAGPNLTDDYWLHKGSINDIYQTLKNGYPAKGMAAWANKFNPKEISLIASYIKTLKGSNPPGAKAPQGDIYEESATSATSASTTSNTNAVTSDSTVVTKNSPWEN